MKTTLMRRLPLPSQSPVEAEAKRNSGTSGRPKVRKGLLPIAVSAVGSTAQTPTSGYTGTLPWCDKCSYHHRIPGPCRERICDNCGKKGHLARTCRKPVKSTNQSSRAGISPACYSCGEVGHFKRNCPKAATTADPTVAADTWKESTT
ncbi:hypothetical protein Lser_V15G34765 [Lactuca serriola]